MRRREFIGLIYGAAVWPLAIDAQQHDRARKKIGLLIENAADDPQMHQRIAAFQRRIERFGWIPGHEVIE